MTVTELRWVWEIDDLDSPDDAAFDEWTCGGGWMHERPQQVGLVSTITEDEYGAEYEGTAWVAYLEVKPANEPPVRFCEDCAAWLEEKLGVPVPGLDGEKFIAEKH